MSISQLQEYSSLDVWYLDRDTTVTITGVGPVCCLCALPNTGLAVGKGDGQIKLRTPETYAVASVLGQESPVMAMCAMPDGRLVSGHLDGCVHVWNRCDVGDHGRRRCGSGGRVRASRRPRRLRSAPHGAAVGRRTANAGLACIGERDGRVLRLARRTRRLCVPERAPVDSPAGVTGTCDPAVFCGT